MISVLLEVYLQKATCRILDIVADNQSLAYNTQKYVVKFLETEFRLKGFAELFSKSDKEKKAFWGAFFKRRKKIRSPNGEKTA